jgi:hypothetical protein
VRVDKVELPLAGMDPKNLSVVVTETVRGCRHLIAPQVHQDGQVIRIYPRSNPLTNRAPCAIATTTTTQKVSLGKLPRGKYRLRVLTESSEIRKILNVY